MPLLEPKPVKPELAMENVREDYQRAAHAGQHRASQKAIYFPGFPATQYVPYPALTSVTVRNSALPTTGCCGKELPVIKMNLRWQDGGRELVIDPPKHAQTLLDGIRTARPDLAVDDRRGQ